MHITECLYWVKASASPQSQGKCLTFGLEIKGDKTKSLGDNFYTQIH